MKTLAHTHERKMQYVCLVISSGTGMESADNEWLLKHLLMGFMYYCVTYGICYCKILGMYYIPTQPPSPTHHHHTHTHTHK